MQKRYVKLFVSLCLIIGATLSAAQEPTLDIVAKSIVSVFQMNNAKVLCLSADSSLPIIRKGVETFLQQHNTEPNANAVAKAVYTLFPCPFSPYRTELRPAMAKDIEGIWLHPETSQKLKFGPKSPAWEKFVAMPVKCEVVSYYAGGETRNAQVTGQMACPFLNAKSAEALRAYPQVASWKMIKDGVVGISRTDVQEHVEEWEVFVVTKPFSMIGVQFNEGDLVEYMRRERGNDFNVATVFRHLQRLP